MGLRQWRHPASFTPLLLAIVLLLAGCARGARSSNDERGEGCDSALPPIVILPGIMGSDLDVRLNGGPHVMRDSPCSLRRSHSLSVWPPKPDLLTNLKCLSYLLKPVPCANAASSGVHGALCNPPGVDLWVQPGGEAGTKAFAFRQGGYPKLVDYLSDEYGYEQGKNLFAVSYDWRLSLQELEASGQFDAIAKRVEGAVARSCGKKAILVAHSMGTIVALGMLHSETPRFQRWRAESVAAYVALAPPFGGSTYTIASKLGGNKIQLLEMIDNVLQPVLNELVYQVSRGLPSMLMLMPYAGLWGKEHVLVSTPFKNYTLGDDMASLFRDIGDTQSAELFSDAHNLNALLAKGPVEGVATFCVYGSKQPTVQSWRYAGIIKGRAAPPGSATPASTGEGDGVVNVESMRLCSRLTKANHIHELGAGINHANVLYAPESLDAIGAVVTELLGRPEAAKNARAGRNRWG